MSNMHQFHQRITQPAEVFDPYFQGLAQLKQADRDTIAVLASAFEWLNWGDAPGERPAVV